MSVLLFINVCNMFCFSRHARVDYGFFRDYQIFSQMGYRKCNGFFLVFFSSYYPVIIWKFSLMVFFFLFVNFGNDLLSSFYLFLTI